MNINNLKIGDVVYDVWDERGVLYVGRLVCTKIGNGTFTFSGVSCYGDNALLGNEYVRRYLYEYITFGVIDTVIHCHRNFKEIHSVKYYL